MKLATLIYLIGAGVAPAAPLLNSLTVVTAPTGAVVGPLNGYIYDLSNSLSVRADPKSGVGSVIFKLDGAVIRTESTLPYTVAGDSNGVYTAWKPALGAHVLLATPYSASGGQGTAGAPISAGFSVVNRKIPPTPTPTPTITPPPAAMSYAYSEDGNTHDRDDICAFPLAMAIFSASGHAGNVVHVDYCDHFWSTTATQQADMVSVTKVNTTGTWGGFPAGVFYNAYTNTTGAVTHLTSAINAATATKPLTIICAGPMQTVGEAVTASKTSARQYVTLISHSTWNDTHAGVSGPSEGLPAPRYNWTDLASTGVKQIHIKDQNGNINGSYTEYNWLDGTGVPKLQWLWDAGQLANKTNFDCSDAGMVYYAIFGDDNATPTKISSLLAP